MNFNDIPRQFGIDNCLTDFGDGLINNTYITQDGKYVIQRINTAVFTDPVGMTNNIIAVTNHIRSKGKPTLNFLKCGDNYYYNSGSEFWRCYEFIGDTVSYMLAPDTDCLYAEGETIGEFHRLLSDFDPSVLCEPIPDFHHTKKRFEVFKAALKEDRAGRASKVAKQAEFLLAREKYAGLIIDGIEDGSIPLRVTHNDTKINNILFDEKSGKGVCLIDLDTVMPGSYLYDYSDAVRTCAPTSEEDEIDISKVHFSIERFEAFTRGFLSTAVLSERERELLGFSARLMLFENGIRFLTDYLNGDTYFKIKYPDHNLVRTNTQIKLVDEIEQNEDKIRGILDEI